MKILITKRNDTEKEINKVFSIVSKNIGRDDILVIKWIDEAAKKAKTVYLNTDNIKNIYMVKISG